MGWSGTLEESASHLPCDFCSPNAHKNGKIFPLVVIHRKKIEEPDPGILPELIRLARGDAKQPRRLFAGKSGEITELHQLRRGLTDRGRLVLGFAHGDDVFIRRRGCLGE